MEREENGDRQDGAKAPDLHLNSFPHGDSFRMRMPESFELIGFWGCYNVGACLRYDIAQLSTRFSIAMSMKKRR
jgi:hypothetical protein